MDLASILAAIQGQGGGGQQQPSPTESVQDLVDYKPSQVRLDPSAVAKIVGYGDDTQPFPAKKDPSTMTKREKIIDALNRFSNNFLGQGPSFQQQFEMQKENADWRKSRALAIAKYNEESDRNQRDIFNQESTNRRLDIAERGQKQKDQEFQQRQTQQSNEFTQRMDQMSKEFQTREDRQNKTESDRMGIERGNLAVAQAREKREAGKDQDDKKNYAQAVKDADEGRKADELMKTTQASEQAARHGNAYAQQNLLYAHVRANVQGAGRMTQAELQYAMKAGSFGQRIQRQWDLATTGKLDPKSIDDITSNIYNASRVKIQSSRDSWNRYGGGRPLPSWLDQNTATPGVGQPGASQAPSNEVHWNDYKPTTPR